MSKLSHLLVYQIITSSDFVQGQFRFRFALADACRKYTYLPEVVVSSAGSSIFDYARGSTQMEKKNRSRIYDLGVVPTRGNNYIRNSNSETLEPRVIYCMLSFDSCYWSLKYWIADWTSWSNFQTPANIQIAFDKGWQGEKIPSHVSWRFVNKETVSFLTIFPISLFAQGLRF
jgi:hypothetical protein